ncbi:MAG: NAD(P)H-hydrate dehydratase [Planctomycetales bacterium]|nr:NAD(P)H-hydrate dehydratase [Planctomycetales bacterium]
MNLPDLPCPELPQLAARLPDAHKGVFGRALLIGGSCGMAGAISLAGLAALRLGAGLVRLAVPRAVLPTVASFSPCYMTIPLAEDEAGRLGRQAWNEIHPWIAQASCIAIGPGMGKSTELVELVASLLKRISCPVVVDADGLNCLAECGMNWPSMLPRQVILTPHPGEWERLAMASASDRHAQIKKAISAASLHRQRIPGGELTVVLKGQGTVVTDGQSLVVNSTGTPAMATGGSGDVLTGMITALVCQGLVPRDAAHLAVFLHGQAAEISADSRGAHVVLPTELIDSIPAALQSLSGP